MRRTLVHVSDLHVGRSPAHDRACARLTELLRTLAPDHVVATGDLTHRGRASELRRFEQLFAPLLEGGRMTVVPGNHDRIGEGAAGRVMGGRRVDVSVASGLYVVRLDSTGPHNRSLFRSHGALTHEVIAEVRRALDEAPRGLLRALALHHHPLPLPEETLAERVSSYLGWPNALELELGPELLRQIAGRCDLVLHGHRHVPRAQRLTVSGHPLAVVNAGSSPELGGVRVFSHRQGALVGAPRWAFGRPPDVVSEAVRPRPEGAHALRRHLRTLGCGTGQAREIPAG